MRTFAVLFLCAGCVSFQQAHPQFGLRVLVLDGKGRPVKDAVVTAAVSFEPAPLKEKATLPKVYPLPPARTNKDGLVEIVFPGPPFRLKKSFILWPSTTRTPYATFAIVGLTVVGAGTTKNATVLLSHARQEELLTPERFVVVRLGAEMRH